MDLFRIVFNPKKDSDTGVYGISLVEDPANATNFIALSKDKKELKLATASAEKRLLVGPVLIPNQRIYRDWFEEGCEIFFEADTIREASQEFFKNGYQRNSTIDHEGDMLEGVTFVESWIIDDADHDKSKAYGFDLPVGTWMATMKVDSDEIWYNYVKEGKVKGFSIDSFFDIEKVNLNKVNNNKEIKTEMNKDEKSFFKMAKEFFLGSDETKQIDMLEIEVPEVGKLQSEDFSLGFVVMKDVEGEWLPLVDSTFVYEGKEFKTDAEGKIVEITDVPAKEEVVVEAPVVALSQIEKLQADMALIMKALKLETVEEVKDMVVDRADELEDVVTEAKDAMTLEEAMAKIDELQAIINTMKGEVEAVTAENVDLKNTPAGTKLKAITNRQPNGTTKAERRAALLGNL